MSIGLYDEAITRKISNWVKDPALKILKPDESHRLFEMKADEGDDRPLTLPLISLSRDKSIEILNTQKQSKTFNGFVLGSNKVKHITLNVIPIALSYQIDIYTKFLPETDEYVRNFIFNLINYPKVEISIPYNDLNLPHVSNITLESTITDNSDIREHLFLDQFTRFTIRFKIMDAYLFSAPIVDNATIEELIFEAKDKDTNEIVESIKIK